MYIKKENKELPLQGTDRKCEKRAKIKTYTAKSVKKRNYNKKQ